MKKRTMHPNKRVTGNTAWSKAAVNFEQSQHCDPAVASNETDTEVSTASAKTGLLEGVKQVAGSAISAVKSRPVLAGASVIGVAAVAVAASRLADNAAGGRRKSV